MKSPSEPGTAASGRGPQMSIAARLVVTFAAMLALFGVALFVVLHAMSQMERAEQEDARLDRAKHAGHRVAALVREQYIHQAHTIIEWNRSHIDHYKDVARVTAEASHDLTSFAQTPDDRALIEEIVSLVHKNHDDFMNVTLPAIDRDEHDNVRVLHADMEKVVVSAARKVRDLNDHWEARSDAARALATRERSRVRWIAITCFGAAIVLAAFVGLLTTRSIAYRVSALREGARRFGGGDLTRGIELDGRDELADVATALNEMAERLVAHQTELVRSQKLASIGRLSAGVAHEINGPIGIILGYAQVIRKHGVDEEALSAIEDEARQCQRIVQGLLDTSRQDTPRMEAFDLGQLARDAVERLRASGKVADRALTVRAADGVLAFGDEAKLRQVVLNLLGNAVDATERAGRIDIEITERDGGVVLSVTDDGRGVEPTAREHLFEPFYTTKDHGTGLGLAISRAIVEAHRGVLRLESPEQGGTRVEIRLEAPAVEAIA